MYNSEKYFAVLNKDNVVINCYVKHFISTDIETESQYLMAYVKENYLQNDLSEQELLESVVEFLKTQGEETLEEKIDLEYSLDKSITNNQASVGYTYDKKLNAFIAPKPEETYILDTETYEWYPNPDLVYDFDNGGVIVKAKYIKELKCWRGV